MYKISIKKKALNQLYKLPSHIYPKAKDIIDNLSNNPRPTNTRKLKGTKNQFRLRIGDYRIVYEVDDYAQDITIYRIKHRKDAY